MNDIRQCMTRQTREPRPYPSTQLPRDRLLVRTGQMASVMWAGPARDHPVECGPRLKALGICGTAVMEGTPQPAGSHLPAMGLKVAPFLDPHPGLFFARDSYKQQLAAFLADRGNPAHRRRLPCVNDPAARREAIDRCLRHASAYADKDLVWLSLANEGSPAMVNVAFDFCSCEHCAAAFSDWLERKYGSVEDLSLSWGRPLANWAAAVAPTTDEAREAYRRDADCNLAAWFDYRRFSDDSFHEALGELRRELRSRFAGVPLALSGVWPPGVFGAQDWERIALEYDVLESYDECGEFELARSFCEGRADLASTYPLGADPAFWDHSMWMFFIHGLRAFIVDKFRQVLDPSQGFVPTENGRRMGDVLNAMRDRLSPMLAGMERRDDAILVLHSQASQARAWVERNFGGDGDWAGHPEGWVHDNETYLDAERSWYRLIEDAGRQFRVVSARVGLDALPGRGRVLALPCAVALSDRELAWIRGFLESGGVVLHDGPVGRFDGDLRLRPSNQALREQAGSLACRGVAVVAGLGRLLCLANSVRDYARVRLHGDEKLPVLVEAAALFDAALPAPAARIESTRNERVEITTFAKHGEIMLAVHRNDVRVMFDPRCKREPAAPVDLALRLARPAAVRDVLGSREWPTTDRVTFTLDPVWPTLLRLTEISHSREGPCQSGRTRILA